MLWKKNKLIFIHIPKCGGTSIENSLNFIEKGKYWGFDKKISKKLNFPHELQHMTYNAYKKLIKNFKDYKIFTIVRNPFDRAISLYKDTKFKRSDIRKYLQLKEKFTFNEFLIKVQKSNHIHHKNQIYFLNNLNLNKIEVLRFENFENEFKSFLNNYKLKTQIKKSNPSKKLIFEKNLDYYNNTNNIKLVEQKFSDDLKFLKYSFNSFRSDQKFFLVKKFKKFILRKIYS